MLLAAPSGNGHNGCATHLLPCWERPLRLSSDLSVVTVSSLQFLADERSTAEARFFVCCWIGLAGRAVGATCWALAAARSSPAESFRLSMAAEVE